MVGWGLTFIIGIVKRFYVWCEGLTVRQFEQWINPDSLSSGHCSPA